MYLLHASNFLLTCFLLPSSVVVYVKLCLSIGQVGHTPACLSFDLTRQPTNQSLHEILSLPFIVPTSLPPILR